MADLLERRFSIVFALCLAATLTPLLMTRVLPLHDAPGIIGLSGALALVDEPAARIREFYDVDLGPQPSVLYFGWGSLASRVGVPADVAFSLYIGLFCLAGPPLGLLALLRAFGRPSWLAFLAFPIAYHHQIWFGFLGSAAAITGLLLALAAARRVAVAPSLRNHLALAAALFYVGIAHPFALALTFAVIAPLAIWPVAGTPSTPRRLRALALRCACALPVLAFLAPWIARFADAAETSQPAMSAFAHLRQELRGRRPPLGFDLQHFVEWLGNGYATRADELVPLVALCTLGAFLAMGARSGSKAGASRESPAPGATWWLVWAVAVLATGYVFLPQRVFWPTIWWGLRERCVAPLFFVAVALVRPSARGLRSWAGLPAVAVAATFALTIAADFRWYWNARVLDGFDETLAAIPAGASVLSLSANVPPDYHPIHYTLGHPYLVQHHVAHRGGRAVPLLRGHPGSYWITPHEPPPHPPWGRAKEFDFAEHGQSFDYFLLELSEDPPVDPLAALSGGVVKPAAAHGRWRLYEKVR